MNLQVKSGVYTDYRADVLRMGPAPYLSDAQIEEGVRLLREAHL
jgi:kynureninase